MDYNDQYMDQEMMVNQPQGKVRVPSPAKAAIAQSKPRDNKGKFLSGEELQAYQANQQAAQFSAQRQHLQNLLGRNNTGGYNNPQPVNYNQLPSGPGGNNFANIVQANKPGGSINNNNKWNILLGKKTR